jgi:hypothetical protein
MNITALEIKSLKYIDNNYGNFLKVFFCIAAVLFLSAGCNNMQTVKQKISQAEDVNLSVYKAFEPVKLDIIPLTKISGSDKGGNSIELYINLLDASGESVKSPVVLRFELYEYIERSARAKGRRIFIWEDIDITKFSVNIRFWRGHLSTYKFTLPLGKDIPKGKYILHCSCVTSSGNRANGDYILNYKNI